jgi:hypothetical protein
MKSLSPFLKPCPVEYHDENHTYTLRSNGKLVPGVTSIGANLHKPQLVPWAAKEAVKHLGYFDSKTSKKEGEARLAAALFQIKGMDEAQYFAFLEEAKNAHARKSKDAADAGTIAHSLCERYINLLLHGATSTDAHKLDQPTDERALTAFQAFLAWERAHDVTWLASELVVGSAEHEFGGTLDALAIVDGIPSLIDFKTSNQISKDYFIQTAGYHIALEEMGLRMWQRIILRIPKDGSEFEALVVPTPLDLDISAFLALRQVQRWQSYVANTDNNVTNERGFVKVVKEKTAA